MFGGFGQIKIFKKDCSQADSLFYFLVWFLMQFRFEITSLIIIFYHTVFLTYRSREFFISLGGIVPVLYHRISFDVGQFVINVFLVWLLLYAVSCLLCKLLKRFSRNKDTD